MVTHFLVDQLIILIGQIHILLASIHIILGKIMLNPQKNLSETQKKLDSIQRSFRLNQNRRFLLHHLVMTFTVCHGIFFDGPFIEIDGLPF